MKRRGMGARVAALAAAAVVTAAGCSSGPRRGEPGPAAIRGPLTVLAAASLTAAFTQAQPAVEREHPGLSITYDFGGSNALVAAIEQGAPADVFAAADLANMQKLVDAGLVDPPVTMAENTLEIAVAPGNPKGIRGLADLGGPNISVVLGGVGVPSGDYARQVLAAQGVHVRPKSLETDVKAAVAKVTSGEADAAIVYATDIHAAAHQVQGVTIPAAEQPAIRYPIAVVKRSAHRAAAEAFLAAARQGPVKDALLAAGFAPAS